ncbi:MAG: hypothetical protein ACP5TI_05720 [Thermoprotei archaeon]
MNSRTFALVFIALTLLLIWVAASSISPLVTVSQGPSSAASGSLGSGLGNAGLGSGIGGLGLGGINANHNVTKISISKENSTAKPNNGITSLLFFELPIVSLRLPIPIRINPYNITLPKLTQGGSGGGGSSGGASSSSRTSPKQTPILPDLQALIYAALAMIIAAFAFVVTRVHGLGPSDSKAERAQEYKLGSSFAQGGTAKKASEPAYELNGKSVPLRGWGGGETLQIGIPPDLPLIWRVGDPLPYSLKVGATIFCTPGCALAGGNMTFEKPGCYELTVDGGGAKEIYRIKVVNTYAEDAVNAFRANLNGAGKDKTPREISADLAKRGVLGVKEPRQWSSLVAFEACRYGGIELSRSRYEEFIRGLQKLTGPLVVGCEDEPRSLRAEASQACYKVWLGIRRRFAILLRASIRGKTGLSRSFLGTFAGPSSLWFGL